MYNGKGLPFLVGVVLLTGLLGNPASSAWGDMSMTEANRTYSLRFQDWVFLYMNNEFQQAAPPAPDYTIGMRPKIVGDKVRFVITGYYFDTKLGKDWYRRCGSQLESTIAMLCHSWTQQGHPISPDDFEINIHMEKVKRSN